jgi:hypothetical protein
MLELICEQNLYTFTLMLWHNKLECLTLQIILWLGLKTFCFEADAKAYLARVFVPAKQFQLKKILCPWIS